MYRDLLSYLVWYNCFFVRKRERSGVRALHCNSLKCNVGNAASAFRGRGAFRAPADKRRCYHARNNSADIPIADFHKGTPSLAGRPLSENDSLNRFRIHPLRSAFVLFRRSLKTVSGDQRRCLWTLQAFVKA